MAFTKMGNFSFNHSGQPNPLPYAAEDAQSKFDSRANELKSILNAAIDLLNSAADGNSGADNLGMTPIAETGTNATVQSIVEALITRLKATADGASGADLIGTTGIAGVAGANVQAQMESMKGLVDGKAASDDLSGLAGTGRTTETVKGNADDLAAHLAETVTDADGAHGLKIETGAWTPTLVGSVGGAPVHLKKYGYYTKIGPLVKIYCFIELSGVGDISGNLSIAGLPFIVKNQTQRYEVAATQWSNLNLNTATSLTPLGAPGANKIDLYASGNDVSTFPLIASALKSNTHFRMSMEYEV